MLLLACMFASGQQPASRRLSLKEAIALALTNNLGVLLAGAQAGEAAGTRERALSALLPHASGSSLANRQNRNLQVAGISFPGVPTVVGPFTFYDFRVSDSQSLVDRQAYHGWKATVQQEQAAKLSYQDARDQIVRLTAGLYLNSEFAAAQVQVAQSRVETSETLERLARDRPGRDWPLAWTLSAPRCNWPATAKVCSLLRTLCKRRFLNWPDSWAWRRGHLWN